MLRDLSLAVMLSIAAMGCLYYHSGKTPMPETITSPRPEEFLSEPSELLVLPIWRGDDSYFVSSPVVTSTAELDELPTELPRYRDRGWYYHDTQISGPSNRRPRHLYIIARDGRMLVMGYPEKYAWQVTHTAQLGPNWKQELIHRFLEANELSLLEQNGRLERVWALASNEQDFSPEKCQTIEPRWTYVCEAQRLLVQLPAEELVEIQEFLHSARTSSCQECEVWSVVDSLR